MKTATIDSRRRLVMPEECPPKARVTIESLDQFTWIVRVQPSGVRLKRVLVPVIDRLGTDRDWDKLEGKIARDIARRLKEPKQPKDE